ncbi:MAG: hypothetical protein ABUS76_00470 [Candidatus Shikimatogenerans sp. Ttur]|uniref:DNA-directed RNA polymerase n=1 Tax=Candidatus Shikimatogenerans sp. Ttur TaxID=3158569 RepID=A0AAU7ZXG7_9FLAO
MLSIYNILNISNGEPILVPSQDMLLGLYYITKRNYYNKKYINILFSSFKEVKIAYNNNIINIHDNIKIKIDKNVIYTTTGRILFNNLLPHNIKFINKTLKKNILKIIIKKIYIKNDIKIIVKFLDNIKKLGFYYAYKAGLSFGIDNIKTPKKKYYIVKKSIKYTNNIIKNYNKGLLNKEEKYNKIINI